MEVHFARRVIAAKTPGEAIFESDTTALLKMLFEVGIALRGIIGLALYRHTTSRR